MFSKDIRILYLYIISFIALLTIMFSVSSLVDNITRYAFPTDYSFNQETSEEVKYNYQIRTLRQIFTSGAIILIAAPLYLYHWSMIQKERLGEE